MFKLAFKEFIPLAFNLARFFLMIPIAFITLWAVERDLRLPRSEWWPMFVSSVLGFGGYQMLFITGLAHTSASAASLLLSTMPIMTALFLTLGRVEILSALQWTGVVGALSGVVVFIQFGDGLSGFSYGDLMILGAAASFALYGIVNKPVLRRMSPARLMAYGVLFGTIELLPGSWSSLVAQDWSRVTVGGWLGLLYQAVFPVYVAYLLWNWAIHRQGIARTVPVSYLVPVLTGVSAYALLGERLHVGQVLAGLFVLAGVALCRTNAAPEQSLGGGGGN